MSTEQTVERRLTVSIPEDLKTAVKVQAAKLDVSLQALVERYLREGLIRDDQ